MLGNPYFVNRIEKLCWISLKNYVDGNFDILLKWFIDGQNLNKINNTNYLINFFQNKAN